VILGTGIRIGQLVILGLDPRRQGGHGKHPFWLAKCSCGKVASIRSDVLMAKKAKSCGCGKVGPRA
jgi:hypothetical protein